MDKLVRKIEVPLAKSAITDAGLYIASPEDIGRLAEVAMEAYQDYPLHNWLTNGHYDREASKRIMEVSLRTMANDGVIYADSPELNGFAAWLPLGFTGSKTVPFLTNGGLRLILRAGPGIIGRLLTYETFAMRLKEKYTANVDWYLYNLSVRPHRGRASPRSCCAPCWPSATGRISSAIWRPTSRRTWISTGTSRSGWRNRR